MGGRADLSSKIEDLLTVSSENGLNGLEEEVTFPSSKGV